MLRRTVSLPILADNKMYAIFYHTLPTLPILFILFFTLHLFIKLPNIPGYYVLDLVLLDLVPPFYY